MFYLYLKKLSTYFPRKTQKSNRFSVESSGETLNHYTVGMPVTGTTWMTQEPLNVKISENVNPRRTNSPLPRNIDFTIY